MEGNRLISSNMMHKGKAGLFSIIEGKANLRNIRAHVVLTSLLFIISVILHFAVPEMGGVPYFMVYSAVMLVISLAGLAIIQKKKGAGSQHKWIIGIGFIISAVTTTSTMGAAGAVIFVFPMLLSIQYCSVLYSMFISAIAVMGTFVPLLLSSYLANYDLNVARLLPGTKIEIATTLKASLEPGAMNIAATKVNELLSVFLPIILFVTIIAVLTVSICGAIRKSLLEQYHQFQVTRE